jgi:S1-C subfamily serine protease
VYTLRKVSEKPRRDVVFALALSFLSAPAVVAQAKPNFSVESTPLADLVEVSADIFARVETEEGTGAGFYVTASGVVVTALHVITLQDGTIAKKIAVVRSVPAAMIGTSIVQGVKISIKAKLLKADAEHDLALLQPDQNPFAQSYVTVNGRETVAPRHVSALCPRTITLRGGDPVFTIGFALGDLRAITTTGIVASAQPSDFDSSGGLRGTYLVDMLMNHGNSGGPVFSSVGCVVGVADAISLTPVEGGESEKLPKIDLTLSDQMGSRL